MSLMYLRIHIPPLYWPTILWPFGAWMRQVAQWPSTNGAVTTGPTAVVLSLVKVVTPHSIQIKLQDSELWADTLVVYSVWTFLEMVHPSHLSVWRPGSMALRSNPAATPVSVPPLSARAAAVTVQEVRMASSTSLMSPAEFTASMWRLLPAVRPPEMPLRILAQMAPGSMSLADSMQAET